MPQPDYCTPREVAARLRVNERTVRRWIAENKLPAVRLAGRLLRVRRADVDALLQDVR